MPQPVRLRQRSRPPPPPPGRTGPIAWIRAGVWSSGRLLAALLALSGVAGAETGWLGPFASGSDSFAGEARLAIWALASSRDSPLPLATSSVIRASK